MSQTAQIRTEEKDSVAILRVQGFLARLEVYKLKHEFDAQFDAGRKSFLLDLTHVDHIDSAGVGTLVKIRNSCQAAGGQVGLITPTSENARRILEVSALRTVINFYDSEIDGLQAMGIPAKASEGPPPAASPGGLDSLRLEVEEVRARLQAMEYRISRIENKL